VVFSEVKEESGGNGHKEMSLGASCPIIGTSTDVDDMRGDTGATLVEMETGTREEAKVATS